MDWKEALKLIQEKKWEAMRFKLKWTEKFKTDARQIPEIKINETYEK